MLEHYRQRYIGLIAGIVRVGVCERLSVWDQSHFSVVQVN